MKAIQTRTYIGLFGILVLLVVLNTLSNQIFRGLIVDVTDENLYSLSDGTKQIIKNLNEPVNIKYYFSATDSSDFPAFKIYGERVLDLLNSYVKHSNNIKLEVFDPRPDSEEAEWAENYGLSGIQVMSGEVLYCGLIVQNERGEETTIPFFDSKREEFLEYDLSKAISALANTRKTTVGIYSSINLHGEPAYPGMQQQTQKNEPWYFLNDLKQMYEVKTLDNLSIIDSSINLLVLIHPKNLDEQSQYALDQYILSGKNALILVDPFCENDNAQPDPQNPMMSMTVDRSSRLPKVIENSGIELAVSHVVLERERATQVQTGPGQIVDYYAWLSLTGKETNQSDAVTGKLETLLFPTTGYFKYDKAKNINASFTPLIQTSNTASFNDTNILLFGGTPQKVANAYIPGTSALTLAARITGKFPSSFPNGKPALPDGKVEANPNHLAESKEPANVIVVSDVDFLSNRFSLNITNLFGNTLISPINDNINFFFNAIESISGSINLISIRSRGKFSRPFDKVAEIEANAQMKWQQEEKILVQKVDEANKNISELMKQEDNKNKKAIANAAILAEVQKFREEKKESQKKLREVRKNLRQEKESLGTQLFLFNTFLIPFMILCFGLYCLINPRKTKV